MSTITNRADAFCTRFGLRLPILLAPMAGACPPPLSAAVIGWKVGGLGACGALLLKARRTARLGRQGALQLHRVPNQSVDPGSRPVRDRAHQLTPARFPRHVGTARTGRGRRCRARGFPGPSAQRCLPPRRPWLPRSWDSTRRTSSPSSRTAALPARDRFDRCRSPRRRGGRRRRRRGPGRAGAPRMF